MTAAAQPMKIAAVAARLHDLEVVGGRALADRLLVSFLREVETLAAETDPAAAWPLTAHRTVGMAGMLGFADLAEAFTQIEDGDVSADTLAQAARRLDEAVALASAVRALRDPRG
jgi:HPt (histidine-containing phosphotransfer) domain-containing protein